MWSHIYRTAYTWFQHLCSKIINIFCKPKITNFKHSIINKYIRRFEIPMYNLYAMKISNCLNNEAKQKCSLALCQSSFSSYILIKILPIYVLTHNVYDTFSNNCLDLFNKLGRFQNFEYFCLVSKWRKVYYIAYCYLGSILSNWTVFKAYYLCVFRSRQR